MKPARLRGLPAAQRPRYCSIPDYATSATFGGGAGEEAFASLLTDEYARLLAERGGIGLAEQVFELLKERSRGA